MIHSTAIISEKAEIAENVSIGPYCVINDGVKIGAGSELHSHVVIDGFTEIGVDCEFFPFAMIGGKTQDLKYSGEPTSLLIGDRNVFRENTTIHRSTSHDLPTTIGSDNLFLSYAHVAHDCVIGDHTIFSNNATIGGHVTIGDYAVLSGFAGIHQFCRIGQHSIVGGCTKVVQDIAPYMIADGNPALIRGVNVVGLQRRGFDAEAVRQVKIAYKALFLKKQENFADSLSRLDAPVGLTKEIVEFASETERGLVR